MNYKYLCAMISKYLRLLVLLAIPATIMVSCGEYNKVLKSTDLDYKQEMAEKYFDEGEYVKALPLLEELIPLRRGTKHAAKVYYLYTYCHYHLNDYYLSSYYFKNFAKTYPASQYTEECNFMSAYCYYLNSPKSSLDQSSTERAIEEMQLFMNLYPESSRRDTCNVLIDKMREKLETKSFDQAMLYFKTENYQSASVALNNTLNDYPNSKYKEEILFHILKSNYLLAMNSIPAKKEARLKETIKSYHKFVGSFGESKHKREADNLLDNAKKQLEKLSIVNN